MSISEKIPINIKTLIVKYYSLCDELKNFLTGLFFLILKRIAKWLGIDTESSGIV